MKIYDISLPIHEGMVVYKNREEKRPRIQVTRDFTNSTAYESVLTMDLHTGTHMDAPLHMIEGGEAIDQQDLYRTISPCRVWDLTHVEDCIRREDVARLDIKPGDFPLFKTRNSFDQAFNFDFIYLEKGAAAYLRDQGIIGVGIDSLGIERAQPDHETHRILMSSKIVIIEGLMLRGIQQGEYLLIALPLRIQGAEASPVRAVLVEGIDL